MWRRKLSASIVKWSSSPCSSHAAASTVRSNSLCCVSVGVKAVKSCVPCRSAAAASSARRSSGFGHQSALRSSKGERTSRRSRRYR